MSTNDADDSSKTTSPADVKMDVDEAVDNSPSTCQTSETAAMTPSSDSSTQTSSASDPNSTSSSSSRSSPPADSPKAESNPISLPQVFRLAESQTLARGIKRKRVSFTLTEEALKHLGQEDLLSHHPGHHLNLSGATKKVRRGSVLIADASSLTDDSDIDDASSTGGESSTTDAINGTAEPTTCTPSSSPDSTRSMPEELVEDLEYLVKGPRVKSGYSTQSDCDTLLDPLRRALRRHPCFGQLEASLVIDECSDDQAQEAYEEGNLGIVLLSTVLKSVQAMIDLALAGQDPSLPHRRIQISRAPSSDADDACHSPFIRFVVEDAKTSRQHVLFVLSTEPIALETAAHHIRQASKRDETYPRASPQEGPLRCLISEMAATNAPMGAVYIGSDLLLLERDYLSEVEESRWFEKSFIEETSQRPLQRLKLDHSWIALYSAGGEKTFKRRYGLGGKTHNSLEIFAGIALYADALLGSRPKDFGDEERFDRVLNCTPLDDLLAVVTINGGCPSSLVMALKAEEDAATSDDRFCYFAYGSIGSSVAGSHSPRPFLLFCDTPCLYPGKTALTYAAKLALLDEPLQVPNWTCLQDERGSSILPNHLYRLKSSLGRYLLAEYFVNRDAWRRVVLKLPRASPAKGADLSEEFKRYWRGAQRPGLRSRLQARLRQHRMEHLEEVTERFDRERVAMSMLDTNTGSDSLTQGSESAEVNPERKPSTEGGVSASSLVPHRLFELRLALSPRASRFAAQTPLLNQLLSASYPVMEDHGPSLDMIEAAIESDFKGRGRSSAAWQRHPDLAVVVDAMYGLVESIDTNPAGTSAKEHEAVQSDSARKDSASHVDESDGAAGEDNVKAASGDAEEDVIQKAETSTNEGVSKKRQQGVKKTVAALRAKTKSLLQEMATKGILHGSVYGRNLCIRYMKSDEGIPLELRWIDFARSETREEHRIYRSIRGDIEWTLEAGMQKTRVDEAFDALLMAAGVLPRPPPKQVKPSMYDYYMY